MTPLRFFINSGVRNRTQFAQHAAPQTNDLGGERGTRRRVHERHELVREPRHRAADANPTDIRATANAGHPAAFRHVAVHNRSPASDFHQAFRRTVFAREIALLIVTGAVTTFMHCLSKKPSGAKLFVEWMEGSKARH